MSRAAKKYALISLFVIVLAVLQSVVNGSPVNNADLGGNKGDQIVYRRWVRRRPSEYPTDLYVDEFVEEFHVRRRPPMHIISDEELDRIIRCDFEPSLKECEQLSKPQNPAPTTLAPPLIVRPTHIPTTPRTTQTPTTIRPTSTTAAREILSTTRSTTTTTTSTTTTTTSTTTESPSTTTEDLPFLPDIPTSDEESATEDPNYEVAGELPEEVYKEEMEEEETKDYEEDEEEEEGNDYDNNL